MPKPFQLNRKTLQPAIFENTEEVEVGVEWMP